MCALFTLASFSFRAHKQKFICNLSKHHIRFCSLNCQVLKWSLVCFISSDLKTTNIARGKKAIETISKRAEKKQIEEENASEAPTNQTRSRASRFRRSVWFVLVTMAPSDKELPHHMPSSFLRHWHDQQPNANRRLPNCWMNSCVLTTF